MTTPKSSCWNDPLIMKASLICFEDSTFCGNLIARKAVIPACKTVCESVLYKAMGKTFIRAVWAGLLWLICTSGLQAQAFQNLDFENANVSVIPPGQFGGNVPITNALPFWTGYLGTNQVTQVLHNNLTLGAASIDILGPDWNTNSIIEGQYTLVLQAGLDPFNTFGNNLINASLAQVGLVPANTKSIMLGAAGTNFTVSFAGQTISLLSLGNGPNYTVFGGDISSFAGQVGELRLSTLSPSGEGVLLDAISFSTEAVPEPSVFTLVMIAVVGLGLSRSTSRKAG